MTDVKGGHEVTEAAIASLCAILGCGGAAIVLVDLEGEVVLMNEIHASESIGQVTHRVIEAIMKELDIDLDELDFEEVTVPVPQGPQIVH